MPSAKIRFTGDDSIVRFLSRNRPSTDALCVLHRWREMGSGRDFETIEDTDDHIIAKLMFADSDDSAGPQLQLLGSQHGVEHEFLETILNVKATP